MPTGGVTLDNAGDWIRAGAVAVGVGSALLDAKAIAAGNYDVLAAQRAPHRRQRRGAREGDGVHDSKVVTFGEIMLRLSPPGFERLSAVAAVRRPPSAAAKPTSRSASRSSASTAPT